MLKFTLALSATTILMVQSSSAEIDHGIDFDFSQDEDDDMIPSIDTQKHDDPPIDSPIETETSQDPDQAPIDD